MLQLRLYTEPPKAASETVSAINVDRSCNRCAWSAGVGSACLPADGTPGGLLVLGGGPVKNANRPFASKMGFFIRDLVQKGWKGPSVYDTAVRCPPPAQRMANQKAFPQVAKCQPFTAAIVRDARPTRIIALGSWAVYSLLGRSVDLESVRRGYGRLSDGTPVFLLRDPLQVATNRILKKQYEEDFNWALTAEVPKAHHWNGIVNVVDDYAGARVARRYLEQFKMISWDIETAGQLYDPEFTVLSVACAPVDKDEDDTFVWSQKALLDPLAHGELKALLEDQAIEKTGSNAKFDVIGCIEGLDIHPAPVTFDTQLIRKLLEANVLGRLELVAELVGMGGHKEEAQKYLKAGIAAARRKIWRPGEKSHTHWCVEAIKAGKEAMKYAFGLLADDVLWRYNGRDALTSAKGTYHLGQMIGARPKTLNVWRKLYQPAIPAFVRLERKGIQADRDAFEHFSRYLKMQMDVLREKFKAYDLPGKPFNPSSQPQVSEVMFVRLKLKPFKVSKKTGKASTDKDVLEAYRGVHPFVDLMLEWRHLEKMDGTYASGMIKHIRADGRIHPGYKLDGTETGRVSSEGPNGQNIPRADTVEGKMARDAFTASNGNVLVELDFSQLELRVAAALSGDEEMKKIFESGVDYHLRTAQMIAPIVWGITAEQVGDFHRSYAKTVNFGLLYGKTDNGLAEQLGCTPEVARQVRQAILGKFKKLAKWIAGQLMFAKRHGYIEIPWDAETVHIRPLYEIAGDDQWKQNNAENSAINTPIQGRAGWYALVALPVLQQWIDDMCIAAEPVLTVHDSILFDVHPDVVDLMINEGKRVMGSFDCGGVELVVDAKAGFRWGSLRKVKQGELYADAQVRWVAEAMKKEAA